MVAIHQPTFFPWLGYFDKIARSDIFILLDNVQSQKKGGYGNRVQLVINGRAAWVTMPVVRSFHGTRLIKDMRINSSTPWQKKILRAVQTNYARSPFFSEIFPILTNLINNPTDSLADYNESAIRALASILGLNDTQFIRGSALNAEGAATGLLISLTRAVGGTAYLCGAGGDRYQENDKLAQAGIDLIYQTFKHPVYPQRNTAAFIRGLSIIDTLMNCGIDGTRRLLKEGGI